MLLNVSMWADDIAKVYGIPNYPQSEDWTIADVFLSHVIEGETLNINMYIYVSRNAETVEVQENCFT